MPRLQQLSIFYIGSGAVVVVAVTITVAIIVGCQQPIWVWVTL
jgi:hypothetical protein